MWSAHQEYNQHMYKCLTSRALNPTRGRSLPSVDHRIQQIMKPPNNLDIASRVPLADIAQLFKLETVIKKKEKQTGNEAFGNVDKRSAEPNVGDGDVGEASKRLKLTQDSLDLALTNDSLGTNTTEVGTTTPVQDFEKLLQAGFHINTVTIQMEKVILKLLKVSFGDQMSDKVISCLESYRQACIDMRSPTVYNKFMRELKIVLIGSSNKRDTIWQQIMLRKIGLIDITTCDVAVDVSPADSKAFFADTASNNIPLVNQTGEKKCEDAEDLLDDL